MATIKTDIIHCGDALTVLRRMPSASVDMVMTSPPYWMMRDYGVPGQLGLERTFEEYLHTLCRAFDEVKRVLKPEGTCWVNLGDTYAGSSGCYSPQTQRGKHRLKKAGRFPDTGKNPALVSPRSFKQTVVDKSLCLIPFRFAIEMVNRAWRLRNVIVWNKPNCLPSSATDRFTVDFEYVFFFAKSQKYFFERQFEPHHDSTKRRVEQFVRNHERFDPTRHKYRGPVNHNPYEVLARISRNGLNPLGRNMRCVWSIPTQAFAGAHFATFPERLCELPIRAGCPELICSKCRKPRKRILKPTPCYAALLEANKGSLAYSSKRRRAAIQIGNALKDTPRAPASYYCAGYTDCGCDAPFLPGIVLDPFCGAGTTCLVAHRLHRRFIGIELNPAYVRMANRRLRSKV